MAESFVVSTFTRPLESGFNLYWVDDVVLADLNGDGKTDLLVSYHAQGNVTLPLRLFLGNGSGGLTDGATQVFGATVPRVVMANQFVVADFNGDGRNDVFAADSGHDVSPFPGQPDTLLLSTGAGALSASRIGGNAFAHGATTGDIDDDGDIDIYVANIHGQSDIGPYFLVNNGQGGFSIAADRLPSPIALMQGQVYTTAALADFNGDGKADLFLGSIGLDAARPQVLWNDGTGRFAQAANLPELSTSVTRTYTGAVTSDVNSDGRPDIIAGLGLDSYKGGALQVLVNNGDGTFSDQTAARIVASTALAPAGVSGFFRPTLFDLNGDGRKDIILNGFTETPILIDDGAGRFIAMPKSFIPVPTPASGTITYYPYPDSSPRPPPSVMVDHFKPGDLNGDGRGDLISARGADYGASEQYVVFLGVDPGTQVQGTSAADGLLGDLDSETMLGGGGNDVIVSSGGNDCLYGEADSDLIASGAGADTVWGGDGGDTILEASGSNYLRGEAGEDSLSGGSGFDDMHGNMGNDTLRGNDGEDWVVGGKDNDLIFGDAAWDIVYGNMGNDTVDGGAGNDWERGGQGDDSVMGGAGDDWIWGDKGDDTISGGAGADIFHSLTGAAIDRILDFNVAEGDRLVLDGGPSRTVTQVGADVVVDMGNGDQVILVGVSLAGLGAGWIS